MQAFFKGGQSESVLLFSSLPNLAALSCSTTICLSVALFDAKTDIMSVPWAQSKQTGFANGKHDGIM